MYLVSRASICRQLPPTSQYTHLHKRAHAHMVWISVFKRFSRDCAVKVITMETETSKKIFFTKCLINPEIKMPSMENQASTLFWGHKFQWRL